MCLSLWGLQFEAISTLWQCHKGYTVLGSGHCVEYSVKFYSLFTNKANDLSTAKSTWLTLSCKMKYSHALLRGLIAKH